MSAPFVRVYAVGDFCVAWLSPGGLRPGVPLGWGTLSAALRGVSASPLADGVVLKEKLVIVDKDARSLPVDYRELGIAVPSSPNESVWGASIRLEYLHDFCVSLEMCDKIKAELFLDWVEIPCTVTPSTTTA